MKPKYKIPSMKAVNKRKKVGSVVSTFSGAGGSCLGYKMAGLDVKWASEFIPIAKESYKANHPDVFLNIQDIREVTADQIFKESGIEPGTLDIFDVSPPCDCFTTVGARARLWGAEKQYGCKRQITDDLFFTYIELLKGLMPKVFIAENVTGLVKGTAKGYFNEILRAFKTLDYHVDVRKVQAHYLGVPQRRERIIFQGVRKDLGLHPVYPQRQDFVYSVRDAFENLITDYEPAPPRLTIHRLNQWKKSPPGKADPSSFSYIVLNPDHPAQTVTGSPFYHWKEKRHITIPEVKRLCSFPDDFILKGNYAAQYDRCGKAVPPIMMREIAKTIKTKVLGYK